jgi:hypothetical protein
MKKRVRYGWYATRKDLMVSEEELEDINKDGVQETKKLRYCVAQKIPELKKLLYRTREVTTVDVVSTAAKLRKKIKEAHIDKV